MDLLPGSWMHRQIRMTECRLKIHVCAEISSNHQSQFQQTASEWISTSSSLWSENFLPVLQENDILTRILSETTLWMFTSQTTKHYTFNIKYTGVYLTPNRHILYLENRAFHNRIFEVKIVSSQRGKWSHFCLLFDFNKITKFTLNTI